MPSIANRYFDIIIFEKRLYKLRLTDSKGWELMARDSINNVHILVVEDNASNRRVAKIMLERLGYKADVVSSGLEAIEAVRNSHYDLVLMDIVMPEMDGLEASREMRKLGQEKLKIIAITAYVVPGIMEMCLKAGMDDCITKPIRMKDLELALKRINRP